LKTSRDDYSSGPRVFIADDAPDTFEFLTSAVAGGDGWVKAGEARTLDAFLQKAADVAADVWLVSSAFLGLMSKEDLRRAISANPEGIIIAVTDSKDYAELKAALRRGARDVIVGGASAEEARELVETHYAENVKRRELRSLQAPIADAESSFEGDRETAAGEGYIAMITGADGGTGKSFIAAQLAGICARHAKAKTCLVDLDCMFGSLAATLELANTGRSIIDLIQVAEELEPGQVESVTVNHPAGFSLVPGPTVNNAGDFHNLKQIPLGKILGILRELFEVIICDIPQSLCDAEVIKITDAAYIVATPDKTSAHCAGLLGQRVPGSRLILNMADRRGAFSETKMAEMCGLPVEATVPEDIGAGRLFDKDGEVLAARTNLAITRSLIPVAQRCRHFEELVTEKRFVWLPWQK
jgi:Flp pilus assembly CpaE family ATPase